MTEIRVVKMTQALQVVGACIAHVVVVAVNWLGSPTMSSPSSNQLLLTQISCR